MMSDNILAWGLQPPEGTEAAWGARTIYTPPDGIDVLHDRQSSRGTDKVRAALVGWINDHGMDLLRGRLRVSVLRGNSNETIKIEDRGYVIEASPRGSHGYLYLVVYPVSPVHEKA